MSRIWLLTAAFVFTGVAAWATPHPVALPDSIGVEYRNNKMLIKHRVTPGETLYGLARRYKVPVEDIVEANSGQKGALVTGQVVLVPRNRVVLTTPGAGRPAPAATAAAVRSLPTDTRGNRIYKVEAGQTLFSIARRFQTTPDVLARLNGVTPTYNVRLGQTLIIAPGPAGASAAAPARSATPAPAQPVPTQPAPSPSAPVAAAPTRPVPAPRPERTEEPARDRDKQAREQQQARTKDSAATTTPSPTEPKEEEAADRVPNRASEIVRRVSESGLATVIQTDASDKYLALHKTAPVGTIMQVRNIMNGQSVYVRVIGPLPDTGENTNILVRLSRKAVQRLATPDQRFRVETSYVP
ncbi:LysM peptidoglycan-binding domain-containing protein [Hymenobacter weizhouensis]|uniref:LysM peptidoglycan-binding domain-containing protein n=1 Tax=Hymenobacter sp. YIM 151500-1 TaxID=2987689 RepID=UPI002226EE11|nr:LysM peptidoglycan-binding domain-containing protein [Hymenobacter sp. YIM 151500-1]UYZ63814.1 LysM peptidoglycan-binding domain-containing protein [Hymenobacter sp. YIM 151500-1]